MSTSAWACICEFYWLECFIIFPNPVILLAAVKLCRRQRIKVNSQLLLNHRVYCMSLAFVQFSLFLTKTHSNNINFSRVKFLSLSLALNVKGHKKIYCWQFERWTFHLKWKFMYPLYVCLWKTFISHATVTLCKHTDMKRRF